MSTAFSRRSPASTVLDEEDAPPKPFGYVIDYCGVLKDLSEALSTYDALQGL